MRDEEEEKDNKIKKIEKNNCIFSKFPLYKFTVSHATFIL